MRVLVIHRSERVRALRIQAEQDVILVRRTHEVSGEIKLPFRQVNLWLQSLKRFFVFQREHNDGRSGVVGSGRHQQMKDCAHPFELLGNPARLLLIGIGEHYKVRGSHFKPVIG